MAKKPETWRMKIIKHLSETQGATIRSIAVALGVNWATVYNLLPLMKRLGHVKEVKRAEVTPVGSSILVRRLYATKGGREWLELAKT